jgi:glucose/arabinose dehydrogenase
LGAVGGKIILGEGNLRGQLVFSIGNPEIWQGFENIKVRQDLGRIVSINLETYAVRTISTGHRNPQGLCFESNTLWSTEQGPEGGDEINIIKSNRSYGWPYVTMGHAYGSLLDRDWINPFTDSGYEKPIFSYVPSVATGSLKCPSLLSPKFLRPDFFMATLRDTSIHRLRFESRRLVLDERIPIGSRVRDIDWLPNKELLVLTDSGEVLTLHFASIIN